VALSTSNASRNSPPLSDHAGTNCSKRLSPSPVRHRCELPDIEEIIAAGSFALPSKLCEAWRVYAANAGNPYSYSSFVAHVKAGIAAASKPLRQGANEGKPRAIEFIASDLYWRARTIPRPKILTIGNAATLRVQHERLEVEERAPRHLNPGRTPIQATISAIGSKPHAIVFAGRGEFISGEAIGFCAEHSIGLIFPTKAQEFIALVESSLESDRSRLAPNPILVRGQCAAAPAPIAREIIRQKLETCVAVRCLPPSDAHRFTRALDKARSLEGIMAIEARVAATYWDARQCTLPERRGGRLPPAWKRFAQRN
jgi:CRISPR associated protein Cas1